MASRQLFRSASRRLTSWPSQHASASRRQLCSAAPKPSVKTPTSASSEDEDESKKPGAIGGFMRGLVGGQTVAVEDAFIAEAKEQGVEIPPPTSTQLVTVKRRRRREEDAEQESVRDRIFGRFKGSAFMNGVFEAKERIQERIEYSDNPIINFFRNVSDRMFSENEMATVIREVRVEMPEFRISDFLVTVQEQLVPEILGAYLSGDRDKLENACTEEAYAMLSASLKEREVEGIVMDTNILDVDDVELTAGKMMGEAPVLIVTFTAQQINCLRNRMGEVIEGKEDDIRAVYYAWAFVQDSILFGDEAEDEAEKEGVNEDPDEDRAKHKDGRKWRLMEMVIRAAHGTI